MPQIIVAADRGAAFGEGSVTFRERVNVADFESEHFAAQLVERLGWAVEDADVEERRRDEPAPPKEPTDDGREPEGPRDQRELHEHEPAEPAEPAEPVGESSPHEDPVAIHTSA